MQKINSLHHFSEQIVGVGAIEHVYVRINVELFTDHTLDIEQC